MEHSKDVKQGTSFLFATMDLLRVLERGIVAKLSCDYPVNTDESATAWVSE